MNFIVFKLRNNKFLQYLILKILSINIIIFFVNNIIKICIYFFII